ncbi:MAG: type II toxin-antitoxin system PemK/MazF family toxin [Candidatus Omnitrophica bacterium]|nr:type II toxin-antitoxin system PemK/MazF family toxin [Candidatus Omnitrophota bacterium]MBU4472989.1 type II toxin-antitoxin system PemK/MazF family toxin [Candidatus Omnitrophota bacterium]MCG2706805.1 type II toxin-antitoxin system PemK/MazF family toxin [Candidatus Omnitrophota bacterium]
MTKYKRQDVVLVDFGFSEETGSKKRPALVISSDNYHKSRREVVVLAITSNIRRVLFGDTKIDRWKEAGLLYPSLITGIIRTIKDNMIIRKLGTLSQQDFQKVQETLRKVTEF